MSPFFALLPHSDPKRVSTRSYVVLWTCSRRSLVPASSRSSRAHSFACCTFAFASDLEHLAEGLAQGFAFAFQALLVVRAHGGLVHGLLALQLLEALLARLQVVGELGAVAFVTLGEARPLLVVEVCSRWASVRASSSCAASAPTSVVWRRVWSCKRRAPPPSGCASAAGRISSTSADICAVCSSRSRCTSRRCACWRPTTPPSCWVADATVM